jgi:oligosaccharide repeat unit polymerase
MAQVITAAAALLAAGVILWCGRRDLTRPAVTFGVPWFAFVALAQLRLTDLEQPWSTGFTLLVFGGGLAFVVAAVLAAGTAGARGTLRIEREQINVRRLLTVAILLILAGVPAVFYRSHVLGGIPLLSDNPDAVRFRVFQNGQVILPGWSSALTGGFYIGMWGVLAAIWALAPRVSRRRLLPLWLIALVALFGVSLEASRNLIIFAVVVPAVGAYLLSRGRDGGERPLLWVVGAICLLVLGVGGLYTLRLERGQSNARDYITHESDKLPAAVRPILPLYVNGAYPFEAARRAYEAVPERVGYEFGAASLSSLPDKLFPEGKSKFGRNLSSLMATGAPGAITWTVGTYQGRLLGDLGWRGVMLGSILLGLMLGSLYRWARGKAGFLPVALISYVAYYSGFMVYDNQLSFSLIAVYDLGIIALMGAYSLGWTDELVAGLRRLARRLSADQGSA